MLAKEKWQIKTIEVLERVFEERKRQMAKHGDAMLYLPDGTGPETGWLTPVSDISAEKTQIEFRRDYEVTRGGDENPAAGLTRMHLVREELAEAFELDGDDPSFVDEILQVAALCVQWAEYKIDDTRANLYRGYRIRIGGPRKDHKVVQIWDAAGEELIDRTISVDHAERIIDEWHVAP